MEVLMFTISDNSMFSTGYVTIFLYLASLTFFLIGLFIPKFLIAGIILATLFFILPSIIIGIMIEGRIET